MVLLRSLRGFAAARGKVPEPSSYIRTEARERMLGMKLTNNRGLLALAIYLILVGFMGAFGITLGALSILVPFLAIVAGVLLLLGQ